MARRNIPIGWAVTNMNKQIIITKAMQREADWQMLFSTVVLRLYEIAICTELDQHGCRRWSLGNFCRLEGPGNLELYIRKRPSLPRGTYLVG